MLQLQPTRRSLPTLQHLRLLHPSPRRPRSEVDRRRMSMWPAANAANPASLSQVTTPRCRPLRSRCSLIRKLRLLLRARARSVVVLPRRKLKATSLPSVRADARRRRTSPLLPAAALPASQPAPVAQALRLRLVLRSRRRAVARERTLDRFALAELSSDPARPAESWPCSRSYDIQVTVLNAATRCDSLLPKLSCTKICLVCIIKRSIVPTIWGGASVCET